MPPSLGSSENWRAMGYKFQFITLAGFHALNLSMFELARAYHAEWHVGVLAAAGKGVQPRVYHGYGP